MEAPREPEETLAAIYDALDACEADRALELCRQALRDAPEEDPVLHLLAGIALLDLDRPGEAVLHLRRGAEIDAEDAEVRANLALALFRACRFEEAEAESERALAADAGLPDAHAVRGLLLERRGRLTEADRHFAHAARLDPERFPAPQRLDRAAFEAEIVRAGEKLPDRFRRLLGEVAVLVEDVPSDDLVFEESPPLDPELLGLFVGISLPELTQFGGPGHLPPRILLFQRNLERLTAGTDELREEIAVTLYHELGHYLGFDEEELEDLDLG